MRGLYLAEAALLTQQAKLNLISNNMANQRSAGFKKDALAQVSFGEWLLRCRSGHAARPVGSAAHSVAAGEIRPDLSPGLIEEAGRELDFALAEGYFTIQSGDGLIYTRNGRFFLDPEGYLVTAAGLPVLGEGGAIRLESTAFTVDRGGMIYQQDRPLDRLRVTFFSPDARLEKTGESYFRLLNEGVLPPGQSPRLYWRSLEGSNVELTGEMVALIQVRRSFEASQKMLSSYDQLLNRAANVLGALN